MVIDIIIYSYPVFGVTHLCLCYKQFGLPMTGNYLDIWYDYLKRPFVSSTFAIKKAIFRFFPVFRIVKIYYNPVKCRNENTAGNPELYFKLSDRENP